MKKIKSLSIFFPALNDSRSLPDLVEKAQKVAVRITNDFEIIVINDGSTDNTYEVLQGLKKQYSCLKAIHHSKNLGYGKALRSGFANSKKEWVFYTDGDGQYNPNEITKLVDKIKENIDVVNGYKLKRKDNLLRIIFGICYNRLLHLIYRLPISDIDCDFRLIRRRLLEKIELSSSSGIICLELVIKLYKAGARFTEVGVHHYKRAYGRSRFFTFGKLLKTFLENIIFFIRFKIHKNI